MFERTLQDLIRGLRAHKASSKAQEDAFLAEAMAEIREELKGKDMSLKAEGILKMCYLMMLYPIPPASGFAFHVVEVMSSPRFHLKQLGYMAAPLAFTGETEEVVLTVNGIKKDLMSPHIALPPLPLNALPHLLSLSPSLSHTLHSDLLHLLTHSSPRIRKRAVLCLLPCWEAFPEGLREGFPRLRERLADEDSGVMGATVGVVMELARRQGGKNYLPLAPELFGILTQSSNNWMLIKVVKLFAILTPLEPRLVRKLLPPITSLISSTSAISLLYECVRTCIVGGMLDPDRPEGEALARVCVEKLGGYLRDEGGDQNLRYIALLAMVRIIPTHPVMVAEYQDEILQSLDDPDVSIRMRALDLVASMVDPQNLQHIADQLLAHLAPSPPQLPSAVSSLRALSSSTPKDATAAAVTSSPSYRLLVAQKLLSIISYDTYANVTDFSWVVSILVDVANVSHVAVGEVVREMLLDVVGRVKSVREHAVRVLERTLADDGLREHARDDKGNGEEGVLEAALWICGEYSSSLASPLSTINNVLSPSLSQDSAAIISLSLLATAKIFASHCSASSPSYTSDTHQTTSALVSSIHSGISPFISHPDIEVQQRAFEISQMLNFVSADLASYKPSSSNGDPELRSGFEDSNPDYPKSLFLFPPLFSSHPLNALGANAQAAVPPPDGLDLDRDIVPGGGWLDDDLVLEEESEEEKVDLGEGGGAGMEELRRVLREQDGKERRKGKGKKKEDMTAEELAERAKRKAERKARQKDNPYYLNDKDDEIDEIPIVKLDLDDAGDAEDAPAQPTRAKSKVKQAKTAPPPDLDRAGELPPGAAPPQTTQDAAQVAPVEFGLAGVDLISPPPPAESRTNSTGRFQEYDLDEKETKQEDLPAAAEVEVVRVKRKKKKKAVE